jgi:alpha-tubulin suppressor-like RCC1 family protein
LSKSGTVFAVGTQQDGVCGTGSTGEYIVSAGRVAYAPIVRFQKVEGGLLGHHISDISCGASHSLALTDNGQVFSWGSGGYGRLGHGDNKDVLSPKSLRLFEIERMRVAYISTGSASSYFVTRIGTMIYMSGVAKRSAEANMAPKPLYDLQGLNIRIIASGFSSTHAATENSLIAWGPSPTSGELGLGEAKKSSSSPALVPEFEKMFIISVCS